MSSLPARPRILFDGRFIDRRYPGIRRYCLELLAGLASFDHGLDVVVLRSEDDTETELVPFDTVTTARSERSPLDGVSMPLLVRRLGIDLVHSPFLSAVPWTGCRRVICVHDLIPLRLPETLAKRRQRWLYAAALHCSLNADRLLVPSRATRRDLLDHAAPSIAARIDVVPLAAGRRFGELPAMPVAGRSLDLPQRFAVVVSSSKPHKNLPRLVSAWRRLAEQLDASGLEEGLEDVWTLLVVGDDANRFQSLASSAESKDARHVVFMPSVSEDQLIDIYRRASLCIVPSLIEGFGLPLAEAMATGTAVACSDIPVFREFVFREFGVREQKGDAVEFFDPTSPASMTEALRRLIDDPTRRRELAERGRALASESSWREAARLTAASYRRAFAGPLDTPGTG